MNTAELAAKLQHTQYPVRLAQDVVEDAKANGLVIVYGASDDLMEFEGAIYDELGACEGATAYLTSAGLLTNDCDNEECPHFEKLKVNAASIEAVWDDGEYSWTFKTSIPHATFEVLEDDEKYCRGIVFALADVVS